MIAHVFLCDPCELRESLLLHFVRGGPRYAANLLWRSWRTSGQSKRVVSAYDRPCPSLAAGARQSKRCSWRTRRFCPPLASARLLSDGSAAGAPVIHGWLFCELRESLARACGRSKAGRPLALQPFECPAHAVEPFQLWLPAK